MIHRLIPFFIHPLPLFAISLMALNDHYLKRAYPGWLTGKLSDFCGMFYFPLFVAALIVLALALIGSERKLWRGLLLGTILFADLLLIAVKTSPTVAALVDTIIGRYLFDSKIMPDPTDLIALSMNLPTYRFGARFFAGGSGAAGASGGVDALNPASAEPTPPRDSRR